MLCVALRCVALRCVAFRCISLRCVALRCVSLRCAALRFVALRCVALRCVALRCVALRCVVLRYVALYRIVRAVMHYLFAQTYHLLRKFTPIVWSACTIILSYRDRLKADQGDFLLAKFVVLFKRGRSLVIVLSPSTVCRPLKVLLSASGTTCIL